MRPLIRCLAWYLYGLRLPISDTERPVFPTLPADIKVTIPATCPEPEVVAIFSAFWSCVHPDFSGAPTRRSVFATAIRRARTGVLSGVLDAFPDLDPDAAARILAPRHAPSGTAAAYPPRAVPRTKRLYANEVATAVGDAVATCHARFKAPYRDGPTRGAAPRAFEALHTVWGGGADRIIRGRDLISGGAPAATPRQYAAGLAVRRGSSSSEDDRAARRTRKAVVDTSNWANEPSAATHAVTALPPGGEHCDSAPGAGADVTTEGGAPTAPSASAPSGPSGPTSDGVERYKTRGGAAAAAFPPTRCATRDGYATVSMLASTPLATAHAAVEAAAVGWTFAPPIPVGPLGPTTTTTYYGAPAAATYGGYDPDTADGWGGVGGGRARATEAAVRRVVGNIPLVGPDACPTPPPEVLLAVASASFVHPLLAGHACGRGGGAGAALVEAADVATAFAGAAEQSAVAARLRPPAVPPPHAAAACAFLNDASHPLASAGAMGCAAALWASSIVTLQLVVSELAAPPQRAASRETLAVERAAAARAAAAAMGAAGDFVRAAAAAYAAAASGRVGPAGMIAEGGSVGSWGGDGGTLRSDVAAYVDAISAAYAAGHAPRDEGESETSFLARWAMLFGAPVATSADVAAAGLGSADPAARPHDARGTRTLPGATCGRGVATLSDPRRDAEGRGGTGPVAPDCSAAPTLGATDAVALTTVRTHAWSLAEQTLAAGAVAADYVCDVMDSAALAAAALVG